jgi:group I intron endonuclease
MEVFYVGKGCGKRAYTKHHRNKWWHNIVNKYGYKVIITDYYKTSAEAGNAEIEMIAEYRGLGCELVNQTNGGDGGSFGRIWSEDTIKKLSKAKSGSKNAFYGKHHTKAIKKRISTANSGKKNSFYGKHHTKKTKAKMKAGWVRRRLKTAFALVSLELSITKSEK